MVNISASEDYWSPALDPSDLDHSIGHSDHGDNRFHHDQKENGSPSSSAIHPSMIVLLIVCTLAILSGVVVFVLKWQRRRYQNCTWASKLYFNNR